jgi:hypothetical protein
MCHNCGVSTTFYNFLKQVDPNLVQEYQLERYKNGDHNNNYPKLEFEEYKQEAPKFKKALELPSIDSLPETHFAKNYVQQRRIPEAFSSQLYYAEDFREFVTSLGIEKEGLHKDDKRLVIPFYDREKNLVAIQGRSLGESKLRYITLKLHDDNKKVFGLDRIDEDELVYVVEGPIDSMFLTNAVATADSNLESITDVLDKSKVVLMFDNEPRNKEIVAKLEHAIDNHFNVVIWPQMIEEKDINDMVLIDNFSQDEIQDIISKNTFVNLRAKMEFVNWKKV